MCFFSMTGVAFSLYFTIEKTEMSTVWSKMYYWLTSPPWLKSRFIAPQLPGTNQTDTVSLKVGKMILGGDSQAFQRTCCCPISQTVAQNKEYSKMLCVVLSTPTWCYYMSS